MMRFILETLGLIAALFVGAWVMLYAIDTIKFRWIDAEVYGVLPAGYPELANECEGIFTTTDGPIEYAITDDGDLMLRCPIRLFPLIEEVIIKNPPQSLLDQIPDDHEELLDKEQDD
jgi:hypothetical protein